VNSQGQSIAHGEKLPREFYLGSDVVALAKQVLGKVICSNVDGHFCSAVIVEAEAYKAPDDKASHAWNNRRTARTEIMYRRGGVAYIYLCYGIHHLFNIVTGPADSAHAILLRGVEPLEGTEIMLRRRNMDEMAPRLAAGPGSLSQAMGFYTKYTGEDLVEGRRYWLEDRGIQIDPGKILASPRVGVQYAGESALWPWRFRLAGSQWTSPAK
jgi:DNA-3-methyladenine glycosylase